MDLTGETAMVTGSSKNIGQEIAKKFAEAGADVGITSRSDIEGCRMTESAVLEAGADATIAVGDIAEPREIERIVADIREELGPISILVNNASYRPYSPFTDVELRDWEAVHDIDFRAQALLSQAVIPEMIEMGGGSIINIIGDSVYHGMPGKTHVMANKAGIAGLTRGLAFEYGPDGVRANAVSLGLIDTERDLGNYDSFERYARTIERISALRRLGTPAEVADVCLFLASDHSSLITGQVVHANAGTFPIYDASNVA